MFSKSCQYGMRAVLYLAMHTQEEKKRSGKEMAASLGIPAPFLAKILQQLVRAQLISSSKGPTGGFYLSKKNAASSLWQVVVCLDGESVFDACILGLPICSADNPCPLHTQARAYRERLMKLLGEHTVADFARRIQREKLAV